MEYIDNSHKIRIEWTILRGTSKVREDFSRAKLALILLGPDWRYQLSPDIVDVEKGVIKTEIPAGLPEGVYGIKAIWIKDDHHPCEGRHFIHPKHPPVPPAHHPVPVGPHFYPYAGMWHKGYIPVPLDIRINSGKLAQARKDDLFGVTELVPECEHPGNTIVIKISSSVATYGYDGLDAYELAVLHGETMTEEEWLAGQSGGAGFRVIDSVDDEYIDDSTDALSVRQGVLLRQMIETLTARVDEMSAVTPKITITPIAEGLVPEIGGDVVFTYEVVGGINYITIDADGIPYDHNSDTHTITLHVPANTDSLDIKTFMLILKGMVTRESDAVQVAEATATIQQKAHTPVVISRAVDTQHIVFTYNEALAEGGKVQVKSLRIPIIRTYDINLRIGSNTETVTYVYGSSSNVYVPSLTFSKVYNPSGTNQISITGISPTTGELTVGARDIADEGVEDTNVVSVAFSFSSVGNLPALQGNATANLKQRPAGIHIIGYTDPEVRTFSYPTNLLWNDNDQKTPTILIRLGVIYNNSSEPVNSDCSLSEWKALGGTCQFDFPSGVTGYQDTGKISVIQNDTSSDKTYTIGLTATFDGRSSSTKTFDVKKLAKPGDTYGAVNFSQGATSNYLKFSILPSAVSSTPLQLLSASQQVNGEWRKFDLSEIENFSVELDSTYDWVSNPRFEASANNPSSLYVRVTTTKNTSSSDRSFNLKLKGTLHGENFSYTITNIKQQGMAYQVYYGYSSAVPTSFSNRGTSNNTNIGTGPFTVRTTRENQAHCHWIMIPQGSGYSLSSVKDDNNGEIINHFIQSENTFTDGTTNYTMYYDTDEGYFVNTSSFYLTR